MATGVDADFLLKVSEGYMGVDCEPGVIAHANPLLPEAETSRPILGTIKACDLEGYPVGDELKDLSTFVHEIIHALVRLP